MLKAIEHGKMARWIDEHGDPHSALDTYRDHEDHLTAAVFARLSYLPTDVLWSVISKAIDGSRADLALRAQPRLEGIRFWPRFVADEEGAREKEPDALLSFRTFDVLVEAKRRDGVEHQTPEQVQDQIDAYLAEERDKPVYVLLVSGRLVGDFARLSGHAALLETSWFNIRRAVWQTKDKGTNELDQCHWQRVLNDIEKALALHGVRPKYVIEDIPLNLLESLEKLRLNQTLWST